MMGMTFASVSPMPAVADVPTPGITGIFAAVIGAGLVMFGMAAATGIRILSSVDCKGNRYHQYYQYHQCIVAISIGSGMLPLVAEQYAQQMPKSLSSLLRSGILLAAFSAVLKNLFFNGLASNGQAHVAVRDNTHGSE